MQHKRPINLDLRYLNFPAMAITSILHRISGIILFLFLPIMLYFLKLSTTQDGFNILNNLMTKPLVKSILWAFGSALIYHSIAGVRHILMDFGLGENVAVGRRSAIAVILLAVLFSLGLGGLLW